MSTLALNTVSAMVNRLPTMQERRDAVAALLHVAIELTRSAEGDAFVRGRFEELRHQMADHPPTIALRMPH